jgi:hypothetical protein
LATTESPVRPEGFAQKPDVPVRSDRTVGWLLLAFFMALYLITGGGHGYSPDGEFAWRMARSLIMDPTHEYLKSERSRSGLDQWGIMVPVLAQPLTIIGETVAPYLPQKDYVLLNGQSFVLGIFKGKDTAADAPTVGAAGTGAETSYTSPELKNGPATKLTVISFLALSSDIPQGATVAELTLVDSDGNQLVFPLRAGIETAEWNRGKGAPSAQHQMANVASIWGGNPNGRNYYAEFSLGGTRTISSFSVRYLQPIGHLYIRSMGLTNQDTGSFEKIPDTARFWSERENDELFARLIFSAYNAIITAIGCVLLFALARLFAYSQSVSVIATAIYGLATLAWPYSKYDFSEPTLVMFILASIYLILRWGQNGRGRFLLLAGLTALCATATKYFAGVLVPLLVLEVGLLHWERHPKASKLPSAIKPILLFCLPFLVVAVPALWYLGSHYGYSPSILEAWAGVQRGWLPLPMEIGLRGLLFSPGKSFFLYSPPTILAVLSVFPFVRRHGLKSVGLLAIILVYFLIYSKKPAWHAGAGWGPRYQVLVIPIVILLIAPLIRKAVEERHRLAQYALIATFVLGVGMQSLAISKSFDNYLGMFRQHIVTQLPDKGAQYGGADYYPYSEGLDDHNSITATIWAWPFSPVLTHAWLLSADALAIGPAFFQPAKEWLLGNPPWKLWGIDATLEHPEYGLGFDFWSTKLRTDFPSYVGFQIVVFVLLLLLESAVVVCGARLASVAFGGSSLNGRAARNWIVISIVALVLFDVIHFLL